MPAVAATERANPGSRASPGSSEEQHADRAAQRRQGGARAARRQRQERHRAHGGGADDARARPRQDHEPDERQAGHDRLHAAVDGSPAQRPQHAGQHDRDVRPGHGGQVRQPRPAEVLLEDGIHRAGVADDEAGSRPAGRGSSTRPAAALSAARRPPAARWSVPGPPTRVGGPRAERTATRSSAACGSDVPDADAHTLPRAAGAPLLGRGEEQHAAPRRCGRRRRRVRSRSRRRRPGRPGPGEHVRVAVQLEDDRPPSDRPPAPTAAVSSPAPHRGPPPCAAVTATPASTARTRADRAAGRAAQRRRQGGRRHRGDARAARAGSAAPAARRTRRSRPPGSAGGPPRSSELLLAVGGRRGSAHTRTSPASSAAIDGPIPGTSSNWSTLVNGPCRSGGRRSAGPGRGRCPGSVSSSATLAVFRSSGPPDAARAAWWCRALRRGHAHGDLLPVGDDRGQIHRRRVRLGSRPPAASTASATRAPDGSVTRPGRATRPTTDTTTVGGGVGRPHRPAVGGAAAAAGCCVLGAPIASDTGSTAGRFSQVQPTRSSAATDRRPRGTGHRAARDPSGPLGPAPDGVPSRPAAPGSARRARDRARSSAGDQAADSSAPPSGRRRAASPGAGALREQRPQARPDDVGVVAAAGGEAHPGR